MSGSKIKKSSTGKKRGRPSKIVNPANSSEPVQETIAPVQETTEQPIVTPPEQPPVAPSPQPIATPPPDPVTTWSYSTPLEQPPEGVTLDARVIEINGMKFQKRSDCNYKIDYYKVVDKIARVNKFTPEQREAKPLLNEINIYRNLIQQDLWFFVYFVMKNPLANHPFIVEACKEIENETGDSLEVWARDHLKTTIISVGRTCQKILNDPERRIGIFSAVRPLAVKIQNLIKRLFESNFLIACFPDILYVDPYKEAEKWTEAPEGGLIVKRKGFYKEATVSSWGLVEGMPIGDHYTDMVFDDIVTQDLTGQDIMAKVCDNFDMAENIGTRDRQITVVGTFYRHDDPLVYISNKTDPKTNEKMFKVRKKPATTDGSFAGKSVFLPESALQRKRAGKPYFFYCQQLLNPTPRGQEKLDRDQIVVISRKELPTRLYKFMLIDGSGDTGKRKDRKADAWAMVVIGVEPYKDDNGASRIFILDLLIKDMDLATAQQAAVDMYCRNGRILKLGIEKVGMSTTEIHICSALRAKKRFLSIKAGNLEIMKPGGRSKDFRIESALSWPLKNGKVHALSSLDKESFAILGDEMEKFPAGHDNGLDAISYVYDIIKNYRFGNLPEEKEEESFYDRAFRKAREGSRIGGWIAV